MLKTAKRVCGVGKVEQCFPVGMHQVVWLTKSVLQKSNGAVISYDQGES